MTSPSTHVLDSSVCIDLYWADLIRSVLALPLDLVLPDLIYVELSNPKDMSTAFKGIRVSQLTGSQISRVYALSQDKRCRGLTINDLAAFVLAKDMGGILLTNDRRLRILADHEGVHYHGTLWVLDKLVSSGTVTAKAAAAALETMIAHGAWFPKFECERRLIRWRRP